MQLHVIGSTKALQVLIQLFNIGSFAPHLNVHDAKYKKTWYLIARNLYLASLAFHQLYLHHALAVVCGCKKARQLTIFGIKLVYVIDYVV